MDAEASPRPPLIGLLVRYGLVGAVNTGIGLAVILGLEFGLKASPVLANAAGYAVGFAVGFLLNRGFVFRSEAGVSVAGPRYLAAVAACYGLNLLVLQGLRAVLPTGDLPHAAAQLCAMGTYTVTLFALSRYWVFAGGRSR
jgi:putative flippase GtrA